MKGVQKALLTNFYMPQLSTVPMRVTFISFALLRHRFHFILLHILHCPTTSKIWLIFRIHTQLKHSSHLFKAQVSGKAGSCFLKVCAASLIHPHKVTQTQLYNTYLLCCLSPSFCTTANLQLEINCLRLT